ncbi:hypothetical protein AT959_02130 [Dechloromonas denitrificans]|uniref:Uncharacterized protein n=1 Tax=Dechloromonas denitrificans TaxID=281362 RepID=A0A133XNL2_9RHOO|nr:hypothetical protein [Dechloromonas denitrificans]KXB32505.1 hypothetical protein AT959_02130 [Dechloromonas denitrificans]
MSMFDNIRCEVPLPDDFEGDPLFQTKDFERVLATHVIRGDGLYLDDGHYETVPKAERPNPDAADGTLEDLKGSLRWAPNLVHHPEAHGIVNFYGDDAAGTLHEYEAKFMDGQLIGIKVRTDFPKADVIDSE